MIQREIACKKIFLKVPFYQNVLFNKKHLKAVESSTLVVNSIRDNNRVSFKRKKSIKQIATSVLAHKSQTLFR